MTAAQGRRGLGTAAGCVAGPITKRSVPIGTAAPEPAVAVAETDPRAAEAVAMAMAVVKAAAMAGRAETMAGLDSSESARRPVLRHGA